MTPRHAAAWKLFLDAARVGLDGLTEDHPYAEHADAATAILDALKTGGAPPADPHLAVAYGALRDLWYESGAVLGAATPLAQARALVALDTSRGAARSVLDPIKRAVFSESAK